MVPDLLRAYGLQKPVPTFRILFVDDRWKRVQYAMEKYAPPKYELVLSSNVKETLRLLSREDFDEVSLDHDLNGCDFEDPDTPTCGMEIVRYIEKCGWPEERKQPTFSIHSSNLFAAHLMIARLNRIGLWAYYDPIVYPDEHMKYDGEGKPLP